ncbi:hypothetical protein M409DRAFT_30544 [Zasmidium cellare ATCC 36951]|uniref:Heterokaryon incompatibility domain-containing protein n=1 Tax=Zasmidium cellare ATCC 36951 TaxID=1080233 RepID=A0A6A6BZM3_ZASCE|nr:uncharacterized protein M409DRAFT_30544 [Zasmidium cellare ATCC 36951]KAF2159009.1 hypothetical protein M409DRAFT_30544 [Zasmidium cellare ATCC 36951]
MDTLPPPNSFISSLTPSLAEIQLPCRGCELDARQLDVLDTDFPLAGHVEEQTIVAKRLYTPINPWETRLLILRREEGSPNLITTLDVATVTRGRGLVIKERNELVPYFALSYTWGDPRFDRVLKVNHEMYPITSNLFRALVRLSYSSGPVRVWIDAICINQHDPKEKSAHIRNIFFFFQDADTVVVWLGEHGPKTEATFRLANDFILKQQSTLWSICDMHQRVLYFGLRDLSRRKWFPRTWVRQEMWAARKLAFLCGYSVAPWTTLQRLHLMTSEFPGFKWRKLARALQRSLLGLEVASQEEVLTRRLGDYRNPLLLDLQPQRKDIMNVLKRTATCECSDPRDRIYGVVGMTTTVITEGDPTSEEPSLRIDYNKSVSHVFQDVSRYVIARDQSLALLHLNASYGAHVEGEALPTWAVNWQRPFLGAPDLSRPECLIMSGRVVGELVADEIVTSFIFAQTAADHMPFRMRSSPLFGTDLGDVSGRVFPSIPIGPEFEKLVKAKVEQQAIIVSVDHRNNENNDYVKTVSIRTQQMILNRVLPWRADPVLAPDSIPLREVDSKPLMCQNHPHYISEHCGTMELRKRPVYESLDFNHQPEFFGAERSSHRHYEDKHRARWCKQRSHESRPFRVRNGIAYSSWSVPRQAHVDDVIVLPSLTCMPLVLRPSLQMEGAYEFIGMAMIIAGTWSGNSPCCDGLPSKDDDEVESFDLLWTWLDYGSRAAGVEPTDFTVV